MKRVKAPEIHVGDNRSCWIRDCSLPPATVFSVQLTNEELLFAYCVEHVQIGLGRGYPMYGPYVATEDVEDEWE